MVSVLVFVEHIVRLIQPDATLADTHSHTRARIHSHTSTCYCLHAIFWIWVCGIGMRRRSMSDGDRIICTRVSEYNVCVCCVWQRWCRRHQLVTAACFHPHMHEHVWTFVCVYMCVTCSVYATHSAYIIVMKWIPLLCDDDDKYIQNYTWKRNRNHYWNYDCYCCCHKWMTQHTDTHKPLVSSWYAYMFGHKYTTEDSMALDSFGETSGKTDDRVNNILYKIRSTRWRRPSSRIRSMWMRWICDNSDA